MNTPPPSTPDDDAAAAADIVAGAEHMLQRVVAVQEALRLLGLHPAPPCAVIGCPHPAGGGTEADLCTRHAAIYRDGKADW